MAKLKTPDTGRLHITQADESVVTLSAPTRFIASKIETQFSDTVRRLWNKHDQVDPPRRLAFAANPSAVRTPPNIPASKQTPARKETLKASVTDIKTGAVQTSVESPRDRFTFDNFVVGASNELAMAVARQVASQCGSGRAPQYNPIIIHGTPLKTPFAKIIQISGCASSRQKTLSQALLPACAGKDAKVLLPLRPHCAM